jgi:DNA-binding transcriptional LysR family regulator
MLKHRQIEAFHAAVRLGSASAAAEALYVTQPAVSRLIADLERRVGFALFERRQRGLHPTDDGILLFEEVERSFRGMDLIAEAAEAIRSHRIGRVRVIAMPAYADGFLSRIIGDFIVKHPGIMIELEIAPKKATIARVLSEQFDLGITTLPLDEPGLQVHRLVTREAVCVYHKSHRFRGAPTVDAADLAEEPFVALSTGSPFRLAIDHLLRGVGVQPRIVAEVRTQRAICNMVAARAGVSILDSGVAQDFVPRHLASARVRPALDWTVAAVTPQRTIPSQATQALLQELAAVLQDDPA